VAGREGGILIAHAINCRAMRRAILVGLGLLAACSGEVPAASRGDKLRVLAVRAEPPEVMPGQAAALDTLTVQPPTGNDGGAAPENAYPLPACVHEPCA